MNDMMRLSSWSQWGKGKQLSWLYGHWPNDAWFDGKSNAVPWRHWWRQNFPTYMPLDFEWSFQSPGPDLNMGWPNYDPTNGTTSGGDIWYFSSGRRFPGG